MYPSPIQKLVDMLTTFPGVGPRQAARFVFHVLNEPEAFRKGLADTIAEISAMLLTCTRCGNIEAKRDAAEGLCSICAGARRDKGRIAVVEDVMDLRAIERTKSYNGLYHVLGGALGAKNPPEEIAVRVQRLLQRIADEKPQEVVIATSPTYEGDTTARYLERELAKTAVKVTRLARGLSKGVDLEYVDEETLQAALTGRR